eukprot:11981214-Ditylum_brightwellii.AAC.2
MDNKELHYCALNLTTNITLGNTLWLGTDSIAKTQYGSYGWILANDSFCLWEGKCQAFVNPKQMQSLRTERVGLLDGLRFIYRYITYHNLSLHEDTVIHYCDNSTLVGRMAKCNFHKFPTPTQYTLPDWDAQMSISHTLAQLHLFLPSKHVYGHQDTCNRPNSMYNTTQSTADNNKIHNSYKKQKKKLSWETKLNIQADELATQAINALLSKKPTKDTFHYLPHAKINLTIDNKPILS